jgi:hypothetical protein
MEPSGPIKAGKLVTSLATIGLSGIIVLHQRIQNMILLVSTGIYLWYVA